MTASSDAYHDLRAELVRLQFAVQDLLHFGSWRGDGTFVYAPSPDLNAIGVLDALVRQTPASSSSGDNRQDEAR